MADLNDISIFTRVVEHNSFSAAARYLKMPNSAISRKVARLENQLGVKLLQRTTRKLHLTEAGELFYRHCAHLVAEAEEAERLVSKLQQQPQGHLKITTPIEVGSYFLCDFVADFMTKYPDLQIEIELTSRWVDLIEEGFDLAIRAGQAADSSLIGRKLVTARQVIVASPMYLQQHDPIRSPQDLKGHNCILPWWQKKVSWQFYKNNETESVNIRGRLRSNNLSFMRKSAELDQGITLLPGFVCRESLQDHKLARLLSDYSIAGIELYAMYPDRRYLPQKVRLFLDELILFVRNFDW